MFSWKQLEAQLRQIINAAIRFIKARRREEASITFGAFLIWAGIYFPEWLEKAGVKEFVASWKGGVISRSLLIATGAGLFLYAAFKIFRLVYVPDLPPPQDRPSAIKGPMAFTEDDGALFRKLGRENDLQKLLGLILDNQVVMVIVRGASGAGKTSLLRAGLTHILAEKGVKYHYWEAAPTEPINLERFTWLSSDSVEELELRATPSSNSIAGLASLSRCHSLKKLTLNLTFSHVNNLEPLAKLSNLTQLSLNLSSSKVSDLEPLAKLSNLTQLSLKLSLNQMSDLESLAKLSNLTQLSLGLGASQARDLAPLSTLMRLQTLSIGSATRAQRMSLRNIPAALVELKF